MRIIHIFDIFNMLAFHMMGNAKYTRTFTLIPALESVVFNKIGYLNYSTYLNFDDDDIFCFFCIDDTKIDHVHYQKQKGGL